MKLVVLLLACSLSATWQQDVYWPSPYSWLPYYSGYSNRAPQSPSKFFPGAAGFRPHNRASNKDTIELLKLLIEQNEKDNEKQVQVEVDSSIEARANPLSKKKNNNKEEVAQDRAFGLGFLGFNALANYVANSISFTTTSTTYSTLTSTLTIGTVATCYTATMFTSTTACRRKKRLLPGLVASEDRIEDFKVDPSAVLAIEPTMSGIDIIKREGRSFADDLKHIIESSQQEPSIETSHDAEFETRLARQSPRLFGLAAHEALEHLPEETVYVSTSTITSYSLYTSSVTRTITGLAAASVLSCLPACFTLC